MAGKIISSALVTNNISAKSSLSKQTSGITINYITINYIAVGCVEDKQIVLILQLLLYQQNTHN